jgi:flagellar biosynthesis protein FlhB
VKQLFDADVVEIGLWCSRKVEDFTTECTRYITILYCTYFTSIVLNNIINNTNSIVSSTTTGSRNNYNNIIEIIKNIMSASESVLMTLFSGSVLVTYIVTLSIVENGTKTTMKCVCGLKIRGNVKSTKSNVTV